MICFLAGGKEHGGGAQTITVLLFEELSNRGIACKLYDIRGGSVYNELIDRNVKFDFVDIENRLDCSKSLTNEDLLIVFDCNLWGNIYKFRNSNCKILLWEIYYPWVERFVNLRLLPSKKLINLFEKPILDEIYKHKAFFFIDYMGKDIFEKRVNKRINWDCNLPIPIKIESKIINKELSNDRLIISYVGRSVNWKIHPFIKFYNDFVDIKTEGNIIFNIVCDNTIIFKNHISQNCKTSNNIRINYFENLSLIDLNDLLSKSDLHFAMGTAALDGAKLGIPTILIDACSENFPEIYKYRWIYQTDNLNLGKVVTNQTKLFDGNMSMSNLIEDLRNNYSLISEKCFNYVSDNYDRIAIANTIIEYEKRATLRMTDIENKMLSKYITFLKRYNIEKTINSFFEKIKK